MTGQDGTADRDGHGMGDERSGATPDRGRARRGETGRGGQGAYEGVPTSELPYGETPPSPEPPYRDTPPAPKPSYDRVRLEAVLGAAILGGKADAEGERRAVDAFRVARDAGAHRARTRRRDDWRPRAQRQRARTWKATLSVLLASLTLGGVAYAAIGAGGGGPAKSAAGDGSTRPSVTTSAPAQSPSSPRPSVSAPADRPATAKDTLAHCRVYEKLQGRGKAPDSTAFRRLVAAAGGEENVSAYCAALTEPATDAADVKPGKRKGQATAGSNADKNKSKKH